MGVPVAASARKPEPLRVKSPLAAVALCLIAALAAVPSGAQTGEPGSTMGAGAVKAAPAAARPASAASAPSRRSSTSPVWSELTASQQQALAPLAGAWPTISEAQKRKWLVISRSYAGLPAAEQQKLHSRMTEWVALSPQQRTQARLNFAETKQLSPDDKKAKWEAYQALSLEEKSKLAAGAASAVKPPATAAAVTPVPPQKRATVPKAAEARPPRGAAPPVQPPPAILATQPAPPPAPVPVN